MIHITLTGPAAGYPICGIRKADAPLSDVFRHAPYTGLGEFLSNPNLCPGCKREWLEV